MNLLLFDFDGVLVDSLDVYEKTVTDCLNAIGDLYPFVTHTQLPHDSDQCPYCSACYYNPPIPHNGDTHGQEFGDPATTGKRAHRTYEASIAVFSSSRFWQTRSKISPWPNWPERIRCGPRMSIAWVRGKR